jgi:hypothetical protein
MSTAKAATATKAEQTETTTLKVVKMQPEQVNPIAERLKKIHEAQTLTEKRTKLVWALDDLRNFENGMNSETDRIQLSTEAGGKVDIKKPDAVKKIVALLNLELETAISELEDQLLNATI